MTTTRCTGGCAPEAGGGPVEERKRYWSVASDWDTSEDAADGKVPVAGDVVKILKGWNMFYDVPPEEAVPIASL